MPKNWELICNQKILVKYNMVYINNPIDFTLTPPGAGPAPAFQSALNNSADMTFEQAATSNHIYKGNGLVCQQQMCNSLTGCDSKLGCPQHPDWKRVLEFCGPNNTGGISDDGAYWVLVPAESRQQLVTATQKRLGLPALPNPYNVTGMY